MVVQSSWIVAQSSSSRRAHEPLGRMLLTENLLHTYPGSECLLVVTVEQGQAPTGDLLGGEYGSMHGPPPARLTNPGTPGGKLLPDTVRLVVVRRGQERIFSLARFRWNHG
jgi:hypothetical protein